jgi:choline dehydrogenase-like flavoprotein
MITPEYHTIIVGAGTCGVAMASRLINQSSRTVLVIEAGPDWGPFTQGNWPSAVLDPTVMPVNDWQWDYVSAARNATPNLPLERGKMMGGQLVLIFLAKISQLCLICIYLIIFFHIFKKIIISV